MEAFYLLVVGVGNKKEQEPRVACGMWYVTELSYGEDEELEVGVVCAVSHRVCVRTICEFANF
jgi:hypothetical protein